MFENLIIKILANFKLQLNIEFVMWTNMHISKKSNLEINPCDQSTIDCQYLYSHQEGAYTIY